MSHFTLFLLICTGTSVLGAGIHALIAEGRVNRVKAGSIDLQAECEAKIREIDTLKTRVEILQNQIWFRTKAPDLLPTPSAVQRLPVIARLKQRPLLLAIPDIEEMPTASVSSI